MNRHSPSAPVPITILAGYLGAGKTTLLNMILSADHGRRIAVIVNEFGEIGIDGDLIVNVEDDEVYTLSNGCICCSVREDLIEVVEGLLYGGGEFDQIVIETTGLATPGPVVMGFLNHPDIEESFRIDGVVTVADARHLPLQLDSASEAGSQLAYADRILLNKIDLVGADDLVKLEERIRRINPLAPIVRTLHARADPYDLLDIGGFAAGGNADDLAARCRSAVAGSAGHTSHTHNDDITAIAISIEGNVDPDRFHAWIGPLLERRHRDIYRMKGVLNVRDVAASLVVQGVHGLYMWRYESLRGGITRGSRIVFIGRDLDRAEFQRGMEGCREEC